MDKAKFFLNSADGKQNPYGAQHCKVDGAITAAEAGKHLVDLQNGEGGAYREEQGQLWQTILTGNGGKGYFDEIAGLDGKPGISEADLLILGQIGSMSNPDNDPNSVDQEDFLTLKAIAEGNFSQPPMPVPPANFDIMGQLLQTLGTLCQQMATLISTGSRAQ